MCCDLSTTATACCCPASFPFAAGQHGLGMDEARLAVAALQCLQRLSGATVLASGRSGSAAMGMSQVGWKPFWLVVVGPGLQGWLCQALRCNSRGQLVKHAQCRQYQMCTHGLCNCPLIGAPPSHCCPQHLQIIGAAGGAGRIFAALLSGHDHVAAEAARLLLRFFAPAAARAGVGPWAGEAGAGSAAAPPNEPNEEEAAAAHSAKSVCFISQTRQADVWDSGRLCCNARAGFTGVSLLAGFVLAIPTAVHAAAVLPSCCRCSPLNPCTSHHAHLSAAGVPRWCVCCASLAAPRCSAWLWQRPWQPLCASPAAAPQTRQLWTLCCRQGRCMPGPLRTLLCLVPGDTVANSQQIVRMNELVALRLCPPAILISAFCHLVAKPPQETAALGRPLFTLFSHPAPRVAHAAALLMRAVAEGGAEAAQPMREAALTGERGSA